MEIAALVSMFALAFGAATLLPIPSETLFIGLLVAQPETIVPVIVVASIGNTLGAVVNYAMGVGIEHYRQKRWFPVSEKSLVKAQAWFQRWGVWGLLVCWVPLGDALTVVAGVMRTPFWLFLLFVAIAKTSRYIVLGWLTVAALG